MKYALFLTLLLILAFILPDLAFSQTPPPPPVPPQQTPVDGGLGILAVIGGTFALMKLRNRKHS